VCVCVCVFVSAHNNIITLCCVCAWADTAQC